ncbi:2-oxo-4-hydroxy-4-carboxy-5-ureidoimidazoline decarboxylase [Mycolicibacterium sp. 120266]|uniref:2-oxo-4-hydroxy-4-carboxy-5-ureidoimidazoline decarboxylase n=1 Tax=Mycolicibacterium sp. 120266 TaxID=3090601 RepID=UPI0039A644F8
MLMHQGIGLEAFNAMPQRRAMHAVYECVHCVTLAGDLVAGRPYPDHDALFRRADGLLFGLSEQSVDAILQAYPCSVRPCDDTERSALLAAEQRYSEKFGFDYVMYVAGLCAPDVLTTIADRMHHDVETERKVVRNELAKINRTRLERMLGPEGGFDNW